MSIINLQSSIEKAEARLGAKPARRQRRPRSDAGQLRLEARVLERLRELLLGKERPAMREVLAALRQFCVRHDLRCPSRAALYNALGRVEGHRYLVGDLPEAARAALYNLDDATEVPGSQLAFACFNYGSLRAMSFAAGLPWLDLFQAGLMRGWRDRSRGLLSAVQRARGI